MSSSIIRFCEVTGCRNPDTHVTSQHLCPKCKNRGHGIIECGDEDLIKAYARLPDKRLPRYVHCKHPECSMPWTHTTSYHKCEYCGLNHSISKCPQILETEKDISIKCPICRRLNIVKSTQQKVFGSQNKCSVCLETNANIFLPMCGHICVCSDCLDKMNTNKPINFLNSRDIPTDILEMATYNLVGMGGKIYTIVYSGSGNCYYIKRNDRLDDYRGFLMRKHHWGDHSRELDARKDLYKFIHGYKYIKGF